MVKRWNVEIGDETVKLALKLFWGILGDKLLGEEMWSQGGKDIVWMNDRFEIEKQKDDENKRTNFSE